MIGGCSNKQKKALKDFLYINQKQTGGSVRTHNSIEKKALSQLYIIAVRSFKEDENWGAKKTAAIVREKKREKMLLMKS